MSSRAQVQEIVGRVGDGGCGKRNTSFGRARDVPFSILGIRAVAVRAFVVELQQSVFHPCHFRYSAWVEDLYKPSESGTIALAR